MATTDTTTTMTDGTVLNMGTWVGGWHGQYATAAALQEILTLGWSPVDHRAIRAIMRIKLANMGAWDEYHTNAAVAAIQAAGYSHVGSILQGMTLDEYLAEALEEGEAWLNDRLPDGVYAGFVEGEFGCYLIDDIQGGM